ncbi:MAG: hypothetical protein PHD91_08465 [bacterium]|nr:hypothetical protein [bacterium]MDD3805177.1 hypothetical protein [bacterium]MDD4153731.1 hypothetical protein [bacterium]MDD4558864.1 hypothetical protein [bacterium]
MSVYISSLIVGGVVFILMLLLLAFEFRRYSNGDINRHLLFLRAIIAIVLTFLVFFVAMGTIFLVNERRLLCFVWYVVLAFVLAVIMLLIMDLRAVRHLYNEQRKLILPRESDDDDDRR